MSQAAYSIVIPSRYHSTRLPAKALCDIAGKPLIQHVYERACESDAESVLIATDDERIKDACLAFDAEVLLTAKDHPSGTDRLAEVAAIKGWADDRIIVNLQGDEPLLPPVLLNQVACSLADTETAAMATFCRQFSQVEDFENPNCVKVVFDQHNMALYFSRSSIPHNRDGVSTFSAYHHIGLYAYRAGYLKKFTQSPPGKLEQLEQLEQLRALEMGQQIRVDVTELDTGIGVDTPADLEQARRLLG